MNAYATDTAHGRHPYPVASDTRRAERIAANRQDYYTMWGVVLLVTVCTLGLGVLMVWAALTGMPVILVLVGCGGPVGYSTYKLAQAVSELRYAAHQPRR